MVDDAASDPLLADDAETPLRMSNLVDSQFARVIVERKFCSANEVDLIRAELKSKGDEAANGSLAEALIGRGYITRSQVARLNKAMDDDSLYRPAQQIPPSRHCKVAGSDSIRLENMVHRKAAAARPKS